MIVLGVDVGSRWCAASAVEPGLVHASGTHDVNPDGADSPDIEVTSAVAWVVVCAAWSGAERIAIEHSRTWFPRKGAGPGELAASAANWAVCDRLVRALRGATDLPVVILYRSTWACRVVPHTSGVSNAAAHAALSNFFPPEELAKLAALSPPCKDASHQRDAAGVALGVLLEPAPAPPREPKIAGPREPRAKRSQIGRARGPAALARAEAAALARRAAKRAAGCRCQRRHVRGCPLWGIPVATLVKPTLPP